MKNRIDAFESAEGLYMNELFDNKPIGVTTTGMLNNNASGSGGDTVILNKKHEGYSMGGGAYQSELNPVESFPERDKAWDDKKLPTDSYGDYAEEIISVAPNVVGEYDVVQPKSKKHKVATWEMTGLSIASGTAISFVLMRYFRTKPVTALAIGASMGALTYYMSDKVINKK
jgi:hypothetical protein